MSKKKAKNSSKSCETSRRFVMKGGKSHKFWEICCSRNTHTVCFGRLGAKGQTKTKEFADSAAAKTDADRLIRQKLNKGYREAKNSGKQIRVSSKSSSVTDPTKSSIPKLSWKAYQWEGQIKLPTWAGYRTRIGFDIPTGSRRKSKGKFNLVLMTANEEKVEPSSVQVRAFGYMAEHQKVIHDAVLKAVYRKYGNLSEMCDSQHVEWLRATFGLPEKFSNIDEFKRHMSPSCIYIHTESKGRIAYVGYGFECEWDVEHGLGVMTHRRTVLDVGGEDVAFMGWETLSP